jgi:CubicO group peptidase (beta-lactamase class C family)
MKKYFFYGLFFFFHSTISAQVAPFYRIDSIINAEIAQHNIAGGIALIAKNGKIVHHQAYGFASIDASVKMQENAIFRIASQTKAIVSVAVLQLVEQGRIRLEDPIEMYFPEFSTQKVYLKQADTLLLVDRKRSITIRDLLTHQSGISSADEYPYLQKEFVKYGLSNTGFTQYPSLSAEIAQIAKMPLAHQPGTRFSYGLSTNVLGGLIELVTKQSLSNYLSVNIFKPLGMEDTYFYLPKSKYNRLVEIYIKQDNRLVAADRTKMPVDYSLLNNASYFSAIGGLVSTTNDYFLFLNHLLNATISKSTFRLLQPATVEQLLTNQLGEKTFIFGGFPSPNQFGLGVGLTSVKGQSINKASVGSYFWGGAFNTAYMVDPKRNLITLFYFQRTPFVLPPLLSKLEKTTIEIIDQQ